MTEPSISAYMQCWSEKLATHYALSSFRRSYPTETITLVSDQGEHFDGFAARFRLHYYRSEHKADPRNLGIAGAREYLRRIHDHCLQSTSDFVVLLEDDVTTRRRIRRFPTADCAGPRSNPFAEPFNAHLRRSLGTTHDYGYGLCGGAIFRRQAFLHCYGRPLDLDRLARLDDGIVTFSDMVLTALFLVNGYSFQIWDEISEEHHPVPELRIVRDAAFDHADKRLYGIPFDEGLVPPS